MPEPEPTADLLREVNEALVIACVRQQELAAAAASARRQLEAANAALEAALARERHITDALQRPLTLEIAGDAFAGLSLATLYEAASAEAEVGGDFFDAFLLPQDRVLIAVADATGKGLSAAARTIQVKEVLRAFAREYPHSPASIASRLNDYVCDIRAFAPNAMEDASFVCLSMALIEPATGECAVVSAGAESPIVLRANGAGEAVEPSGLPLGVRSQELYSVTSLRLEPGDTLILLTDGITEARRGNEFFGPEGLIECARAARGRAESLWETGRSILDGARAHGGGALRDDACLLLAQRR